MSREAEDAAIAFLLRLDPATQRELLERFGEVMEEEPLSQSRRLRRVAAALYEAKRALGGTSPSVREYRRMREEHPEWGWPAPGSVTRWLGVRGWNDALVRMRLEPVLEGDVIEGGLGPTYSIDEVVQALRSCAADLGRAPTITDYLAWQRRPDVRERPGRRPASTWVFNRIFGGFPAARVAAGLVESGPAAHPTGLILRTHKYRLSDEQILEDIRFAAARIEGGVTAARTRQPA
jgi:HNH endonuclease